MAIVDVLSIPRTETTTRDDSDRGDDFSDPWEDVESEEEEDQPIQKADEDNGESITWLYFEHCLTPEQIARKTPSPRKTLLACKMLQSTTTTTRPIQKTMSTIVRKTLGPSEKGLSMTRMTS